MKLVFVHGRAQEGRDEDTLHAIWRGALESGYRNSKLPWANDLKSSLPYYGNLMAELAGQSPEVAPMDLRERSAGHQDVNDEAAQLLIDLVEEFAKARQIDPWQPEGDGAPIQRGVLNSGLGLAMLKKLDQVQSISDWSLKKATADVWTYLTDDGVRGRIHDIVGPCIPVKEACVVIGHSLGSVVAYDILMDRRTCANVKAFITLGSPLGINSIRKIVPRNGAERRTPPHVGRWFNARDPRDFVALYNLEPAKFRGPPDIENHDSVKNSTENRHGIVGYLDDPLVAEVVHSSVQ